MGSIKLDETGVKLTELEIQRLWDYCEEITFKEDFTRYYSNFWEVHIPLMDKLKKMLDKGEKA